MSFGGVVEMSAPGMTSAELDELEVLPARNRISLGLLLGLTGLNAFNDNILKMLLVGLAPKVVEGSLGRDIGLWLGAIILLPYILFAPLAGYLSDRFSKRGVILAMLVMQSLVLLGAGVAFKAALGETSVLLALGMFFLLALQSTLFSPAKMGILKELGGSRRIGMLSGGLQMATMVGILGGLSLGGPWFDWLFGQGMPAWEAAATPVWILFGSSLVALVLGFVMQPTPSHGELRFRVGVFWEHFGNLRETLGQKGMGNAMLGVAMYWFVGSVAAAMFVDAGLQLYPSRDDPGAATSASLMTLMVGLGTVLGSLVVAAVCRRKVQLGVVPLGALGMVVALIGAGLWSPGAWAYYASLMALGLCSAVYMVPVQASIQDQAEPSKRGRVLSSMNLLDSVAGIAGVLVLFGLKSGLGLSLRWQFWLLGLLMVVVTVMSGKMLPRHLIRFVGRVLIRFFYRLRTIGEDRVPVMGGVLMLPNHISYMDALILSTAFRRPVRFVIWEPLYRIKQVTWLLKLFGTVPISPERAKDAVRSVVEALKAGELVCMFPEGQLTRHGMLNEMQRGFELMARKAGVPVLPVHEDGMWGSVYSFEDGGCFRKIPRRIRRSVSVWVGEPKAPREATADWLRAELLQLGRDAFLARSCFIRAAESAWPMLANGVRLDAVEWHLIDEVPWVCDAGDAVLVNSVRAYDKLRSGAQVRIAEEAVAGEKLVAVGTMEALRAARGNGDWGGKTVVRAVCVSGRSSVEPGELGVPVYGAWVEAGTGAWVGLCVPNPAMAEGHEDEQAGQREGSLGRLLPGWACVMGEDGAVVSGWHPGDAHEIHLPGVVLDEDGFFMPMEGGKNTLPLS
jgi:acyl-[acyl-carrier-protein]-phospholipid O-acyltransferase/long-chain-fatty-acid--[acyl-carrier-protein] ligase